MTNTNLNDIKFTSAYKHSLNRYPVFSFYIKNISIIKKYKIMKLIIIIVFVFILQLKQNGKR